MDLLNKYENHWTNVNIAQLSRMQWCQRQMLYCAWVLFLSVFQLYSIWRLLQLSVRLFLKNKRKIHLFKNICFPYSFSLSWFIWRHDHLTWNWRVRLGHRDSRVSTPIPLLWRSKTFDCSSLYCMFSYRLWRGRECTLKWKPMNGPMSDMSNFFLCIRISSYHQLWEPSISHYFRRYRFAEWRFPPLSGPLLASACSPFLFLIMTAGVQLQQPGIQPEEMDSVSE